MKDLNILKKTLDQILSEHRKEVDRYKASMDLYDEACKEKLEEIEKDLLDMVPFFCAVDDSAAVVMEQPYENYVVRTPREIVLDFSKLDSRLPDYSYMKNIEIIIDKDDDVRFYDKRTNYLLESGDIMDALCENWDRYRDDLITVGKIFFEKEERRARNIYEKYPETDRHYIKSKGKGLNYENY